MSADKGITRFISTHPDDDHFAGIVELDKAMPIVNFYCVKNGTTKAESTPDFEKYCQLRDSDKAFYIEQGSQRRWLNQSDEARKGAGIQILWPVPNNKYYLEVLKAAKDGKSPNNISAVIKYSVTDSATFLWMGDLETDFMENIKPDLLLPKVNILFAPHHGRDTGTLPPEFLDAMQPDIIVIGEADSKHLNYYDGYNTITQNSAWDISFIVDNNKVHIFSSNPDYSVDFLDDQKVDTMDYYIGTLNV
jgi:beta-lactamase superfamily II metal-dependent hydrolase